jgi:hypothetical protein
LEEPNNRPIALGLSQHLSSSLNSQFTTLHQASDNPSTLQKKNRSARRRIDCLPHYPAQLTFERQIVTEIDLHEVFRALRTAFRIVHDGLFADCKTDHGRILGPIPESRWDSELLEQDLLENVFGCSGPHCDCGTAAFDPWPGDEVADCEVVGVVLVGWEEVEAVQVVNGLGLVSARGFDLLRIDLDEAL